MLHPFKRPSIFEMLNQIVNVREYWNPEGLGEMNFFVCPV